MRKIATCSPAHPILELRTSSMMMAASSVWFLPLLAIFLASSSKEATADPPNIIFLLTDDQDVTAKSLNYMPKLGKLMREEGTEFANYFVPTGLCCPSRSTIIRGQYCHNTKIWDNGGLNNDTYLSGGFRKVIAEGLENTTIATLLRDAGYETFLVGKYLNGYEDGAASHVPVGWDHWFGMTDTAYYGPHFSQQGKLLVTSKDTYQTDFISNVSQSFIRTRDKSKPFFIYIAPFAPHGPSTPAKRHANLFDNFKAPRYPSYNPSDNLQEQKPSWMKTLPLLSSTQIDNIDEFYRNRLRALQAVDEMLQNITNLLKVEGLSDNTYLFYMGDNGQHLGDYRLPAGKRQAYDTDIRVPFLVRGPGIKGGVNVTEVVMSIDLLPTWVDLTGANLPKTYEVDGKSIIPLLHGTDAPQPKVNTFRSVALAEMYGGSGNMGTRYIGMKDFEKNKFWNNTYQAVRVINGSDWAEGANWLYAEWCTGEREFYNVTEDPYEIYNIINTTDPSLLSKLSTLTRMLGSCAGKNCSDTNLAFVAELAGNNKSSELYNHHLRCFNPPDLPGRMPRSLDDTIWELVKEDKAHCRTLVENGFPYADSDLVPNSFLSLWDSCQKQRDTL